jgi:hypothetical protein
MLFTLIAMFSLQIATDRPSLPATIEEATNIVQSDAACQRSDFPPLSMTMYLCEEKFTAWYFTIPDTELPPGFVRRMLVRDGQAIKMLTDSKYYGTDEQEEAFVNWQAAIAAALE